MKIMILSAKSYDFDRRRAKEMGADGYIIKPINRETFLQSVNEIVSDRVAVHYWGVHGTLPVPGPAYTRYGGNTPCVSVEIVSGEPLYVFDCGSGIKKLSDRVMAHAAERLSGARVHLAYALGPHQHGPVLRAAVRARQPDRDLRPLPGRPHHRARDQRADGKRLFPGHHPRIRRAHHVPRPARGNARFRPGAHRHHAAAPSRATASATSSRCRDRTVCYITDNELYLPTDPRHDARYVERLADFVRGADVLITDTTYRDHEYPSKVDWGHSCVSQVADLAARAEVKRLHLFHHDPDQTDDDIDAKLDETRAELARLGSSVICEAPAEGDDLVL